MREPIIDNKQPIVVESKKIVEQHEIEIFTITLRAIGEVTEELIALTWQIPYVDCAGIWYPNSGAERAIFADWCEAKKSMTSSSAPIGCVFSEEGENRLTFAVSETKEVLQNSVGIHEEDGTLLIKILVPFSNFRDKEVYSLQIRMDRRRIPFYQAIQEVACWWEVNCKIIPVFVPEETKEPVYSTWYTYHQNVQDTVIEEDCRTAVSMGFGTIIMDDGWQTDDTNRGYAFCGDWEVSKKRFPDFAKHIQKIHNMGMKYMLWYSIPFLGNQSKMWESFQDKLLFYNDDATIKTGILDPRYSEVREYLIHTYVKAIEEWKLDGFKLDFIDSICEKKEMATYQKDKMDFERVQEAVDCLMKSIYQELSQRNKKVMIEFRQGYIGPNMRRYGNMFRVMDCPNSAIKNRVGIVDLRMMSGNTTVHSDPIMWHADETPEVASIQIISSIFATVQISVPIRTLSDAMKTMLQFWITFMKENKDLLQNQPICALEPHNLYPLVWTQKKEKAIFAVYSDNRIVTLANDVQECILLNGTKGTRMVLETEVNKADIIIKDCYGSTIMQETRKKEGTFWEIQVPVGGQVYWSRRDGSFWGN